VYNMNGTFLYGLQLLSLCTGYGIVYCEYPRLPTRDITKEDGGCLVILSDFAPRAVVKHWQGQGRDLSDMCVRGK